MSVIGPTRTWFLQLSTRPKIMAQGYQTVVVGVSLSSDIIRDGETSKMNWIPDVGRKRHQDNVSWWEKRFAVRREEVYHAESNKVKAEDQLSIVDAFLDKFRTRLDPPQLSYAAVRKFLELADENQLKVDPTPAQYRQINILLDDRRGNTGCKDVNDNWHRARDWNSYAEEGRPPEGANVTCSRMDAGELYRKQLQSVSKPMLSILCT